MGTKNQKQADIKVPKGPHPTPEIDPQGNYVSRETSGVRDNYNDFSNMHGYTIDYIQVVGERSIPQKDGTAKNVIVPQFVSPNSMYQKAVVNKKGKFVRFEVEPNVTDLQWMNFEKQLNAKGQFIYGTIGDTGRLDIRTLPWTSKGMPNPSEGKDVLNGVQIKSLFKALMPKDKKTALVNLNASRPLNTMQKNAVATYIYRLRDLGLIKSEKDINFKNLKELTTKWYRAEEAGGFFDPANKKKY